MGEAVLLRALLLHPIEIDRNLLLRIVWSLLLKIVVVSPHRDDAAFSVGLAVASWLAAGHRVDVLNCFTRSEYAPFSDANSVHANDRLSFVTALRKREDECWQKLCGGKLALTDLRLKDAPIRFHCPVGEVFNVPVRPEEKAVLKIRSAVEGCRSALVLPLGIGAHVDHWTARDAALAGADDTTPYAFYEDLPYAAEADAVPVEHVVEELAGRLQCELLPVFAAAAADDMETAITRKRRLALCYDSQIDDDTVAKIAEYCRRYEGRERLWANAAWRTSLA